MHQILIHRGKVITEQVPAPVVSRGGILIRTAYSCISAGSEMSNMQQSGQSLIQKAFDQPEKVRKVLRMAQAEGIGRTFEKVQGKLDAAVPTGYSLSGVVLAVGEDVKAFKTGDRVAAAGTGQANHAEFVDVPANLVINLPHDLDFPSASTVALGGIAMQGVRRLNPTLGEFVVLIGAGIVGQLALQMLKLSGARVAAIDLDPARLTLAQTLGADKTFQGGTETIVDAVLQWTGGRGADAVLFCASTSNPQVLKQAFQMTRKKGRVVMVGVWGQTLDRADIYEKEIDFLISTSYGPGRYDERYEKQGVDYPFAYVRWTENRNMEEYLRLLSEKKIDASALIQGSYSVTQAEQAFAALQDPAKKPIVVLLNYESNAPAETTLSLRPPSVKRASGKTLRVGLIGAGGFAAGVHLPNLKALKSKFEIHAICNRTGHTAKALAKTYDASYATSDYQKILSDKDIDLVMIATRHNSHGRLVLESLQAGKSVFVEKPLCLERSELEAIQAFYKNAGEAKPLFMIGFNRRFSPFVDEIRQHTKNRQNPLFIHYRMNVGRIPLDHWVHGAEGGGRIRGEACHAIDLFTSLTGARIVRCQTESLTPTSDYFSAADNRVLTFSYDDGSVAVLEYFAVGSAQYPKEFMEVHFDGKTLALNDYKSLEGFGVKVKSPNTRTPDKGHREELDALFQGLTAKEPQWPIPLWDMLQTTDIAIQIEDSGVHPLA